ncbi:merozoite surface protein [Plasmodium reichenowi]|uniref:Merozoite surface protein n=1 Tax=Plasmodium reichenowi TaxID=5854 RepID=A0A060RYW1_PLARE|nr:merozoite surface protein [Plasmodium reichenowi]
MKKIVNVIFYILYLYIYKRNLVQNKTVNKSNLRKGLSTNNSGNGIKSLKDEDEHINIIGDDFSAFSYGGYPIYETTGSVGTGLETVKAIDGENGTSMDSKPKEKKISTEPGVGQVTIGLVNESDSSLENDGKKKENVKKEMLGTENEGSPDSHDSSKEKLNLNDNSKWSDFLKNIVMFGGFGPIVVHDVSDTLSDISKDEVTQKTTKDIGSTLLDFFLPLPTQNTNTYEKKNENKNENKNVSNEKGTPPTYSPILDDGIEFSGGLYFTEKKSTEENKQKNVLESVNLTSWDKDDIVKENEDVKDEKDKDDEEEEKYESEIIKQPEDISDEEEILEENKNDTVDTSDLEKENIPDLSNDNNYYSLIYKNYKDNDKSEKTAQTLITALISLLNGKNELDATIRELKHRFMEFFTYN